MRSKQQIRDDLRQVVKEESLRQWKGGDLAVEYLTLMVGGSRRGLLEDLANYAGTDYSNLDSWHRVAEAWPEPNRDYDYPWTLYRDFYRREDRFTVVAAYIEYAKANGITSNHYRKAQEFDGRKPTTEFSSGRAVEQAKLALEMMPAEEAARIATEVLIRPSMLGNSTTAVLETLAEQAPGAIYAAYAKSQAVRKAVREAQYRDLAEHNRLLENHQQTNPTLRHFAEGDAVFDLIAAANEFSRKVDEILPRLGNLPAQTAIGVNLGSNRMLTSSLEAAEGALERVKKFVTTGRSDLDSFLGSVLRGAKS